MTGICNSSGFATCKFELRCAAEAIAESMALAIEHLEFDNAGDWADAQAGTGPGYRCHAFGEHSLAGDRFMRYDTVDKTS